VVKTATIIWDSAPGIQLGHMIYTGTEFEATLQVVNAFWVTFHIGLEQSASVDLSEPLDKLRLSWDDKNKRPKILVA
jgi:hypothetical protein